MKIMKLHAQKDGFDIREKKGICRGNQMESFNSGDDADFLICLWY